MVNYANAIFTAQKMQMDCANDILEAHRRYEESLEQPKQQNNIYNDYNLLVEDYNRLLQHARSLAASLKDSNNCLDNAKEQFDVMSARIEALENIVNNKNTVIQDLSNQLDQKNKEADDLKSDIEQQQDQMRETIFTLTLVNTVLSTQSLALKSIVNQWEEGKVFQKQYFIKRMQEASRQLDFEKNKSGSTNSTEAIAYLKINNAPVFKKVSEFI
jgi:chromosome segregation ATPase